MTVFDSDPSLRWLFCMTHPDDEISICAWIHRLVQAGAEVWISWTHDTPVRQMEARAVATSLGVDNDRLVFHGAPDGQVIDHLADLHPSFRDMMERIAPDRVVCGAFEQGHLDHDATNWLVNHSTQGAVFEAPFYHPYTTRFPRVNRFAETGRGEAQIELGAAERAFKKQVAKSYPSQRIWLNMVAADVRARIVGDGSLLGSEWLRPQSQTDFREPRLPAALAARVRRSAHWARWLAALDRLPPDLR